MNEKKITAKIQEDENVEGILNLEPLRGPNGYSAYELYVKNLSEGETPLTELEWLESIGKINYYRQYKQTTVTTENNTTTIPININAYNETCLLEVFLNGLRLDNTEYTVNNTSKQIILENPISEDQTIHIVVSKTIVATANDYNLLKGEKGDNGINGVDGQDGLGVPTGGTTGQVLAKKSNSNNDTEWIDPPEGTGGSSVTVVDNLNSTSSTDTLSARQGKLLNEKISKIVESGSNANGNYIKFDNGILECWNTVYVDNITCTSAYHGIYYGAINSTKNISFPYPFIEVPTIIFGPPTDSGIMFLQEAINSKTKDKLPGFYAYSYYKIDTNPQFIYLSYHAIGKWK